MAKHGLMRELFAMESKSKRNRTA